MVATVRHHGPAGKGPPRRKAGDGAGARYRETAHRDPDPATYGSIPSGAFPPDPRSIGMTRGRAGRDGRFPPGISGYDIHAIAMAGNHDNVDTGERFMRIAHVSGHRSERTVNPV